MNELCNHCGNEVSYIGPDALAYCKEHGIVEGNTSPSKCGVCGDPLEMTPAFWTSQGFAHDDCARDLNHDLKVAEARGK